MPLRALLLAITALLIAAPSAGAITLSTNPTTLANSALRDPSQLSSASWDVADADGKSAAVATESLQGFPTYGSDYLVLSSGDASLAPSATQGQQNNNPNANVSNGGGTRGGALDVSVLRLNLTVPPGTNCVSLKFRYFSEEFPEFLNQGYNDGFLAELDPSSPWTMTNHQITAPANFAFMPGGAFVSINSATLTQAAGVGTVYDGGTQLLSAATPVTPGAHALVLSVWDDGDDKYDSAAFVDDVRIFQALPGGCVPGATAAPVDSTAPVTAIDTTPAATSGPSGSFIFSADESATFECRVDAGTWTACAGPYTPLGLTSGSHTFEVRAVDDAGNVDATPASHTWTVDATAPQTTLTGGPTGTTTSTSGEFHARHRRARLDLRVQARRRRLGRLHLAGRLQLAGRRLAHPAGALDRCVRQRGLHARLAHVDGRHDRTGHDDQHRSLRHDERDHRGLHAQLRAGRDLRVPARRRIMGLVLRFALVPGPDRRLAHARGARE